jgi:outer membrane protein assembly factor BamB
MRSGRTIGRIVAALAAVTLSSFIATAAGASSAGPRITALSPGRATAGETVDVTGAGFTSVTRALVHGTPARFKVLSATRLAVTVPASATSGSVAVSAGSETATSPQVLEVTPTLVSFSPTSGGIGRLVTLTGTSFTAPCSDAFGGVAATCTVMSPTKIIAAVPAGAVSGPIRLTVGGTTLTSTSSFTVTVGIALSASSGPPGSSITVAGTGFGPQELVDLYAGTTDEALVTTDVHGNFAYAGFVVPSASQPGPLRLTAAGRHSGLAAQAAFLVETNWTGAGFGPAHRGYNPYENTLDVANVGGIGVAWRYATGGDVLSAPAVVQGVVYAGSDDGNVYALNAATGAKLWSYTTAAPVESSPAVAKGTVYVGSDDHNVYALNAATGAKVWAFTTGAAVASSPSVVNGVVYVGSDDHNVYALNAATGAKLWSFTTGALVFSSPALANGIVYVGSNDDNVYALNAATGAKLWSFKTGGLVLSSPAVSNGVVYVGSSDYNVYALNAGTGAELWSYTTSGFVRSMPAVANGIVYFGSYDGNVYALNATTGTKLWSYMTGLNVASAPAVANGVLYVGSGDENLYALNATTGAELWSYTATGRVDGSPAVANGVVYIGSSDHNIYAFDLTGGLSASARSRRPDVRALHPDVRLDPGLRDKA